MKKNLSVIALLIALFVAATPEAFSQQRTNVVATDCAGVSLRDGNASYTYVDQYGRLCGTGTNGGATESTLTSVLSRLTSILTELQGTLDIAFTNALPAGPNVIGHVIADSGSTTVVSAISTALPAGTNAIGKLAANSGVDIGDVDVTSVPTDPFGANADAAATAGGTGTIQAKLRRISSDSDRAAAALETIRDSTTPVQVIPAAGTLASGKIDTAMTGTTSTSLIGGTASNYIYITECVTSNSSTTVPTDILLQDGSGGTTIYVLPAPAGTGTGTGANGGGFTFPTPLKVPTSGNALYAANVTTGSSTKISCSGFKSTTSY